MIQNRMPKSSDKNRHGSSTQAQAFGMPAGIKIGHMPISLGEKQFLNNERFGDDAILVWIDPTKEFHLAAGTVKLNEGDVLYNIPMISTDMS